MQQKMFFHTKLRYGCGKLMKSKRRGNWFDCSARREDRTSKVYKPSSGAVLAAISNGLRVFFYGEIMNKIELSIWLEKNHPATIGSIVRRKPLYGFGINDAEYVTTPIASGEKLRDPAYAAWSRMINRAYNPKMHLQCPTYIDVTVSSDWQSFSAFRKWWLDNCKEGHALDKDLLLIGNREYGPDTCIYVPQWLNTFTIGCEAPRGDLPIGVSVNNQCGKYQTHCSNPITGKRNHLGMFTDVDAAHKAWLNYKLSLAEQLKPKMDAIDVRIYPNVVTIIKAA